MRHGTGGQDRRARLAEGVDHDLLDAMRRRARRRADGVRAGVCRLAAPAALAPRRSPAPVSDRAGGHGRAGPRLRRRDAARAELLALEPLSKPRTAASSACLRPAIAPPRCWPSTAATHAQGRDRGGPDAQTLALLRALERGRQNRRCSPRRLCRGGAAAAAAGGARCRAARARARCQTAGSCCCRARRAWASRG